MWNPEHIDRPWKFRPTLPIPEGLRNALPYPELVLQAMVRKGFSTAEDALAWLDFTKYSPCSPFEFPGMEKGVERILQAVKRGELIGVWGDFDVDGQTSTAILVSALRELGAGVTYHIPVRATESHGINLDALKSFLSGGVNVILTCDTGITANASIAYAQDAGIDVIVTDHHLLPDPLPPAYALINPRMLPEAHPLASLPGAGTAYKFAEALLQQTGNGEKIRLLHDLVALGAVADLAELAGETRYLVQSGLAHMRANPRPALQKLLEVAEVDPLNLNEEQIAFVLAPRLNAVGRLSDANPMVDFLLSTDEAEISTRVNIIEGLNAHRKVLSEQVFAGAMAMIEADPHVLENPILVLSHADWEAGVVGIVASRLVGLFHRPVILLVGGQGQPLHGSARSVEGIDISALIQANRDCLLTFGGHPMAAGLSLLEENLPAFQRGLVKATEELSGARYTPPELDIDQQLPLYCVSLELAKSLEVLAPYGPGNPALVFSAPNVHIISTTPVGKLGEHLLVDIEEDTGALSRLVWWNGSGLPLPDDRFDLAYTVHASNYRGEEGVQFEWTDYRQTAESLDATSREKQAVILNVDFRKSKTPALDLENLLKSTTAQVWREGIDRFTIEGVNRLGLVPADSLVVWSAPPDIAVLKEVFSRVHPAICYWFLVPPSEHQLEGFLRSLGKLIKRAIITEGVSLNLPALAASTGTTTQMVKLGVEWFAAKGNIKVMDSSPSGLGVEPGGKPDPNALATIQKGLNEKFLELSAFSRFFRTAYLDQMSEELR